MRIQLSDHFTLKKLLKFVFPSIIMMFFTSIYGVVDGLFISNFIGKTGFAAVNFIMPILMVIGAFGFMIGSGGSALISKTLGQGEKEKANKYFSMLIYAAIILGIIFSLLGYMVLKPLVYALGATGQMADDCLTYGYILVGTQTAFILQNVFQNFFVTAEKPKLGLFIIAIAGVTNIVLDAIFVAVFKWGLVGAAVATGISQFTGAIIPIIYFARPNNSLLKFTKTKFYLMPFIHTCTNGSSELMSNISSSIVNALFNIQLLKYVGEDGVSAFGFMMYVGFIFAAIFFGYAIGSSPIIGFHYGAGNTDELKNLRKKA